jgi:flagellar hook assembly protein FlgD
MPTSVGLKSASLRLESNDWDSIPADVKLLGSGIPVREPHILTGSASYDFGTASVGDSVSLMLRITNSGTKESTCHAIDVIGTDSMVSKDALPGIHTVAWDGRNTLGHDVATGTYLYTIEARSTSAHDEVFNQSRTMILLP